MTLRGAVGGLPTRNLATVLVHRVTNLVLKISSLDSVHDLKNIFLILSIFNIDTTYLIVKETSKC